MLGPPMATEDVLRESLEPSGSSLELPWSPSSSASEVTLAGTLDGAEHSRVRGEAVLPRGAAVGRYVVLGKLGSGAMGVVYTAHDPELDRKVALKLLRPRGSAEQMAKGRLRLLAEAQAQARLSHPNVVVVHDVGEHEGQVFVAMEFVEGRTLSMWIGQGGPRRSSSPTRASPWRRCGGRPARSGRRRSCSPSRPAMLTASRGATSTLRSSRSGSRAIARPIRDGEWPREAARGGGVAREPPPIAPVSGSRYPRSGPGR
jgi:hypothetical protein